MRRHGRLRWSQLSRVLDAPAHRTGMEYVVDEVVQYAWVFMCVRKQSEYNSIRSLTSPRHTMSADEFET